MVRCSISGASVLAPGCFFAGLTSEDSQIPSIPSPHCEVNSLAGGCPNLHTPKTGVLPGAVPERSSLLLIGGANRALEIMILKVEPFPSSDSIWS